MKYYIEVAYFGHHAYDTTEYTSLREAKKTARSIAKIYSLALGKPVYENDGTIMPAVDVRVWKETKIVEECDIDMLYLAIPKDELASKSKSV